MEKEQDNEDGGGSRGGTGRRNGRRSCGVNANASRLAIIGLQHVESRDEQTAADGVAPPPNASQQKQTEPPKFREGQPLITPFDRLPLLHITPIGTTDGKLCHSLLLISSERGKHEIKP